MLVSLRVLGRFGHLVRSADSCRLMRLHKVLAAWAHACQTTERHLLTLIHYQFSGQAGEDKAPTITLLRLRTGRLEAAFPPNVVICGTRDGNGGSKALGFHAACLFACSLVQSEAERLSQCSVVEGRRLDLNMYEKEARATVGQAHNPTSH